MGMFCLEPFTAEARNALWRAGTASENGWPIHLQSEAAFIAACNDFDALQTLGRGAIRSVVVRPEENEVGTGWNLLPNMLNKRPEETTVAGFVTYAVVDERFLPNGLAAECGTYLLPRFRGNGLNAALKQAWLSGLLADGPTQNGKPFEQCLFCIQEDNAVAIRALLKLGLTFHVWPPCQGSDKVTPSTPIPDPTLAQFCRRKSWEVSKPVRVFSVHRDAFSSPPK